MYTMLCAVLRLMSNYCDDCMDICSLIDDIICLKEKYIIVYINVLSYKGCNFF